MDFKTCQQGPSCHNQLIFLKYWFKFLARISETLAFTLNHNSSLVVDFICIVSLVFNKEFGFSYVTRFGILSHVCLNFLSFYTTDLCSCPFFFIICLIHVPISEAVHHACIHVLIYTYGDIVIDLCNACYCQIT